MKNVLSANKTLTLPFVGRRRLSQVHQAPTTRHTRVGAGHTQPITIPSVSKKRVASKTSTTPVGSPEHSYV